MFTVTKSFKIPIGHRLSLHKGLCNSIHGHNLKIDIEIVRQELNENFMVIDFYDLKKISNEIIDKWDHALLLNDTDRRFIDNSKKLINPEKVFCLYLGDPTSENMCFVLYNLLFQKFKEFDPWLRLKSVTIWESYESKAKYEG